MANKKISELNSATLPLDNTELVPIVQGGETKKVSVSDLKSDKLDKVSTSGVERAYIINADGSQGTKATSEFGGEQSFTFSQRSARLSASLTAGNWNGFEANSNFAVCNFARGYGASILAIVDSNLRGMNGYVIDGITVKMLNHINFIQPVVETGINFDIQIWKYDFQKNVLNATALNLRKVVDYNYTAVANNLTGYTDKIVSTDSIDTPINHFSKYIIFLRTNAGASFIFPNIDWNFKL
jgi:hypothetical protein